MKVAEKLDDRRGRQLGEHGRNPVEEVDGRILARLEHELADGADALRGSGSASGPANRLPPNGSFSVRRLTGMPMVNASAMTPCFS